MVDKNMLEANIVTLLGIQALPDDRKAALLSRITDMVQKRVTVRVMNALPDDAREAFMEAVASDDGITRDQLIAEHVPNIEVILQEEIVTLKKELQSAVNTET